jgi:MarR-like DNA-binding transcriptional regulator SgrR of sgrS sRNA
MNDLFLLNVPTIHLRFASHFAIEKIAQLLQAKGMKTEVAYERAKALFQGELEKADLYLFNMTRFFTSTQREAFYQHLTERALFQEPIDFKAHDELVGILQQIKGAFLDEQTLKEVQQLAQANRLGVVLSKV